MLVCLLLKCLHRSVAVQLCQLDACRCRDSLAHLCSSLLWYVPFDHWWSQVKVLTAAYAPPLTDKSVDCLCETKQSTCLRHCFLTRKVLHYLLTCAGPLAMPQQPPWWPPPSYQPASFTTSTIHRPDRHSETASLTMLLSRVALGRTVKGSSHFRRPPEGFDACIHSHSQGNIYCVYDNAQAYPEYIVTYKGAGHAVM